MAKDPAFLFYYDRFLSGTISMTDSEVGQYIRLMCIQANKGYVTKKDMSHICRTLDNEVCLKFESQGEDKYVNVILAGICEQRRNFTESRRNNRKGNKSEKTSETYVPHMVNKDVNVNVNSKDIEQYIFSDDIFMESIRIQYPGMNYKKAWGECYLYHTQRKAKLQDWEWRQKFSTWLTRFKDGKAEPNPYKKH